MVNKKERLEELKKDLESKAGTLPLISQPEDVIFGEGNSEAEIMFVGEAGGYWEAKLRRPFVGNAGKLLDQLINSIGLKREDVYISNVVKARPPDNRDPFPNEIEAFKYYLDQEFEIIKPKVIISLGRFAMSKFLPFGKISIDRGKGRVIEYNGQRYILIPMYHPAAALRGATVEGQLREDFKKIPAEIERLEKLMSGIVEEPEEKEKVDSDQLPLI